MESLAFAREPKPVSPHIKSEDASSLANNTLTSYLANIKTKFYDIFRTFYLYAPLNMTDSIVDRGIRYYHLYVSVPSHFSPNMASSWVVFPIFYCREMFEAPTRRKVSVTSLALNCLSAPLPLNCKGGQTTQSAFHELQKISWKVCSII